MLVAVPMVVAVPMIMAVLVVMSVLPCSCGVGCRRSGRGRGLCGAARRWRRACRWRWSLAATRQGAGNPSCGAKRQGGDASQHGGSGSRWASVTLQGSAARIGPAHGDDDPGWAAGDCAGGCRHRHACTAVVGSRPRNGARGRPYDPRVVLCCGCGCRDGEYLPDHRTGVGRRLAATGPPGGGTRERCGRTRGPRRGQHCTSGRLLSTGPVTRTGRAGASVARRGAGQRWLRHPSLRDLSASGRGIGCRTRGGIDGCLHLGCIDCRARSRPVDPGGGWRCGPCGSRRRRIRGARQLHSSLPNASLRGGHFWLRCAVRGTRTPDGSTKEWAGDPLRMPRPATSNMPRPGSMQGRPWWEAAAEHRSR